MSFSEEKWAQCQELRCKSVVLALLPCLSEKVNFGAGTFCRGQIVCICHKIDLCLYDATSGFFSTISSQRAFREQQKQVKVSVQN
jgi:hypothetical protein